MRASVMNKLSDFVDQKSRSRNRQMVVIQVVGYVCVAKNVFVPVAKHLVQCDYGDIVPLAKRVEHGNRITLQLEVFLGGNGVLMDDPIQ